MGIKMDTEVMYAVESVRALVRARAKRGSMLAAAFSLLDKAWDTDASETEILNLSRHAWHVWMGTPEAQRRKILGGWQSHIQRPDFADVLADVVRYADGVVEPMLAIYAGEDETLAVPEWHTFVPGTYPVRVFVRHGASQEDVIETLREVTRLLESGRNWRQAIASPVGKVVTLKKAGKAGKAGGGKKNKE